MKLTLPQKTALIANFSYVLDIAAFAIILPSISEAVAATQEQALSLYSAYGISLSATLIFGGILTDRLPVRTLFAFGVSLYAFAAGLIVLAESLSSLLVLRAAQGIGAALFSPCIPLIISRSGDADSAKSLTIWGFWSGIVAAISPIVFSTIIILLDWRLAWIIVPIIAVISLRTVGSIDETFRLRRSQNSRKTRAVSYLMFTYVFLSYGLTSWFIYSFPLLAEDLYEMQPFEIGLYSTLFWGTFAVVCWFMKKHTGETALFIYLKVSALLLVGGALIFSISPLSMLFIGVAMALANMPTTELILRDTKSTEYGLIASLDITCARLGGALSVVLISPSPIALISTTAMLCIVMLILVYCAQYYQRPSLN